VKYRSLQWIETSESSGSELTGKLKGSLSLERSISFVLQVKKVLDGLNLKKSIVTARTNEGLTLTSKKYRVKDGVMWEVHKSTTDSKYRIEIELDKRLAKLSEQQIRRDKAAKDISDSFGKWKQYSVLGRKVGHVGEKKVEYWVITRGLLH
jgi:hypothetical protein